MKFIQYGFVTHYTITVKHTCLFVTVHFINETAHYNSYMTLIVYRLPLTSILLSHSYHTKFMSYIIKRTHFLSMNRKYVQYSNRHTMHSILISFFLIFETQVSVDSDKVVVTTTWRNQSFHQRHGTQLAQISHSSNNVLRARRGVIRMLIIVVLTFALCNLPYHARKMWQYWYVIPAHIFLYLAQRNYT